MEPAEREPAAQGRVRVTTHSSSAINMRGSRARCGLKLSAAVSQWWSASPTQRQACSVDVWMDPSAAGHDAARAAASTLTS